MSRLTGTVSATQHNDYIIGSNTLFKSEIKVGSKVFIDGIAYRVKFINNDTELMLSTNYTGKSQTGLPISNNIVETVQVSSSVQEPIQTEVVVSVEEVIVTEEVVDVEEPKKSSKKKSSD